MVHEEILVVRSDAITPLLGNNGRGMSFTIKDDVMGFVLGDHEFMDREVAEYDPEYKQIIPYLVVKHQDNYLLTKRTEKQTEKRLHNRLSLGFGGHINPPKSESSENVIIQGLYKELNEEIYLSRIKGIQYCGVVNDDTSEVGQYHLGLLFLLVAGSDTFEIVESDKITGRWASRKEIADVYDSLETWSQIVYRDFIASGHVNLGRLDRI